MQSKPFDISCYNQLHTRFRNIFNDELINEICKNGQTRSFQVENTIMDIGDKMDYFPLIISGTVKILSEDQDGKELLLYYLETGDTCAVSLTLDVRGQKSKIKAVAEEKTEVLFLPVQKVDDWMAKYKEWRHFVMDTYNYRLKEMLQAIDNLAFLNMDERLLKYLRDKAMVTGSKTINATHNQIANDLNSNRVVISRILAKLESEGFLKHSRNKITLERL